MKVSGHQMSGLLQRVAALTRIPNFDPETMVNKWSLAEVNGTSVEIAQADLEKLAEEGILQAIEVRLPNGKKSIAYQEPVESE